MVLMMANSTRYESLTDSWRKASRFSSLSTYSRISQCIERLHISTNVLHSSPSIGIQFYEHGLNLPTLTFKVLLSVAACTHNPFGAITSAQMGSH